MSETSVCRHRLAGFCRGCGIDIGCGGDKIIPYAMGFDLEHPYTKVGNDIIQIVGDCRDLNMFRDGSLDFIYSSHLIEDFYYHQLEKIIYHWQSKLRTGGRLVLYAPDQQKFLQHCNKTGQPINLAHKEEEFSYGGFVQRVLLPVNLKMFPLTLRRVYGAEEVDTYSWEMVLEKSISVPSEV